MVPRAARWGLVALLLGTGGCFLGTPVAKRGVEIRQDLHRDYPDGPFEIDTSAMPAGSVEVRKAGRDRHGKIESLEISGKYPVRIVIEPATQPLQ